MRMGMCLTLAAFFAAGCSTSGLQQCADLTGLYEQGGCRQLEEKPLVEIRFPDGTLLAGASRIVVEQHACAEIRLKSKGRDDIVLTPDPEGPIRWNSDGALVGTSAAKSSGSVTAGFGRASREWKLGLSESGDGLTYTDSRDERGMALLVMPFHERIAVSCEWLRIDPASVLHEQRPATGSSN